LAKLNPAFLLDAGLLDRVQLARQAISLFSFNKDDC
jgi:hypothetical protein